MVVCKFFQQGSCRYGKNCKFEHIYGSQYSYHAPAQTQQTHTAPALTQSGAVTDEQLVKQVQSDVQAALRGGQWILSCYSPFKEKPIFPGITDLSPEEARLFIYEAKATNNLEQAVTYMNNLLKETKQKYEHLLQPNVHIIKVLRSLYKGEIVPSPFTTAPPQNGFNNANNAAASIFRSAVQTAPIISPNSNSAQSIFKQGNSIFNPQGSDPAKQLFSQATSTNVFGPSQPTGNIFAQQNQNTAAKSIFESAVKNNFPTVNQNVIPNQPVSQGNIFQIGKAPQSMFGQFSSKPELIEVDSGVYSKIEELSDVDLEAFKSDSFQLGFIPELPPPHELCAPNTNRTQLF